MKRSQKKINKHTSRIVLYSVILLLFGLGLVLMHWYGKPLQQIRAESTFDSLVDNIEYGKLKGAKVGNSKAQEVPILLYHGILNGPDDGFSITKTAFVDQMLKLKRAGYSTITSQEYLDFISGKKQLAEKSIMITFDDGRKDSYYRADPILKAVGFKAVMYLTSGYSIVDGSKYYLDQSELKKMHATGRWDIEAHADYAGTNQIVVNKNGTTENFFGYLKWLPKKGRVENTAEYRQRVTNELKTVKIRLQALLGKDSVNTLAFPFGDYAQHHEDKTMSRILLTEAAKYYKQVYVQFRPGEPYSSNYYGDNNFISRRIEVKPSLSGDGLVRKLANSIAKPSQFEATMTSSDGWNKEWGVLTLKHNVLSLAADHNSTTAALYLDGTKRLKNYSVSIKIDKLSSESTNIELVGSYENKNNYMGCVFYQDKIVSEAVVDGQHFKISEAKVDSGYRTRSVLSTVLNENIGISCKVDADAKLSSAWDLRDAVGGPAIFVRDKAKGIASVTLEKFRYKSDGITNDTTMPSKPNKQIVYADVDFNDIKHWAELSNTTLNSNDNNFEILFDSSKNDGYLKSTLKKGSFSGLNNNQDKSATVFKIPLNNTIGGGSPVDAYLQYNVMFENKFEFRKAGVLPGLGGGRNNTGGLIPNGYDGWSSRLMWSGDRLGNYAYLPGLDTYGQQYPGTLRNDTSQLIPGHWQCVTLHIKLNGKDQNNGLTEVWLDNNKILLIKNVRFRYGDNLKIDNILFEVFFGGRNDTFASPRTQSIYFDNIFVSNYKATCSEESATSHTPSDIFMLQ